MLHGDLGISLDFQKPISELIGQRLLLTVLLGLATLIFTFEVLKYLPFCIFGYIQVLALAVGLGNTSAAAEYCPTAPRC